MKTSDDAEKRGYEPAGFKIVCDCGKVRKFFFDDSTFDIHPCLCGAHGLCHNYAQKGELEEALISTIEKMPEVEVEYERTVTPKVWNGAATLYDAGASDRLLADYCRLYLAINLSLDLWLLKTSDCKPELEKLGFIRRVEPEITQEPGEVWVYRDGDHHLLLEKTGPGMCWDTWCFEAKHRSRCSFEEPVEPGWKHKHSAKEAAHLMSIPF